MDIKDEASQFAHVAGKKFANATNQATEVMNETGEQLKSFEQRLVKESSEYVQDNPLTSLGIAVAAGFLLSRLMSTNYSS